MNDIIFLTATLKFDNLTQVADSIAENLKYFKNTRITWLICQDTNNGYGDPKPAMEKCGEMGISWFFVPSGKAGQKNYGGAMFNEPLKWLKEAYFKDLDPWVYVLDDDNIICPLMASQLDNMIETADRLNRPAIWMGKLREDAFIDSVRYYYIYGKGMHNEETYANEFMPDPSQLIMRYSLIESIGFYQPCFEYDQYLWWHFYTHSEQLTLPEDWLGYYWENRANANIFQCYHDGISEQVDFNDIDKSIDNEEVMDFNLVIGQEKRCDRFHIPQELGKQIYEMIKKYNEDKGYIKKHDD